MSSSIHFKKQNSIEEISSFIKSIYSKNLVILCIGTDKCIGDSLGPLVGTLLRENNCSIPVYGSLNYPIHASNLINRISEIKARHKDSVFLAIDACVGSPESKGLIYLRNKGIYPGKALDKDLPMVGDYSIVGIVDSWTNIDLFPIHGIRFNLIYQISKVISNAIIDATK